MSENFTHTAILDDVFRLAAAGERLHPAMVEAMRDQRAFARLGAVTRQGDLFTVHLLEQLRRRWDVRTEADRLEPKLAFVLGWLCHRAADRQMKPVFRETEPGQRDSPPECSVYHDAFVFHEVFNHGNESPYHPNMFEGDLVSVPGAEKVNVEQMEKIIQILVQRVLLELHTLIPDRTDIEGWLDDLFKVTQRYTVDRHRYARAIASPDPEKVRRFITDVNFYDREELIIRTARQIQQGQIVDAAVVDEAFRSIPRSHYAQALHKSYGYLLSASEFFESEMTTDELHERLEIGKPGRDGLSV